MTSIVRLPSALQPLAGGLRDVEADGGTVGEVITDLEARFPGMAAQLLDDSGLRRYVNIYLGGTDVRFVDGLATQVPDGARITVLPAVAGG